MTIMLILTVVFAAMNYEQILLQSRYDLSFLKPWGYRLFHLGMPRFAYFDFLIYNPYWSKSQFVGDIPLLNGITLTYGLGALLAAWAVYNKDHLSRKTLYKALGFIALFAFAACTVRQYFHGGHMTRGAISSAELYGYSVAWLLTGIALLIFGIMRKNKTTRMASLAFMILTVLKVFLFDAAD